jgi:hypothetical protein
MSWSWPFAGAAVPDGELYQATVPVASYSSADYNKGAASALVQVLVAVSANDKVASLSAVQKALEKPNKFVQSYRYTAANQQLTLSVKFARKSVNRFLQSIHQPIFSADRTPISDASLEPPALEVPTQEANLPVSSTERAPVLVWLVEGDTEDSSHILYDLSNPAVAAMETASKEHAIPLLWPVVDLEDMAALSPGQIWQVDLSAIQEASRRYQVTNLLVGKLEQGSEGKWKGNWIWLKDGEPQKAIETEGRSASVAAAVVLSALAGVAESMPADQAPLLPPVIDDGQSQSFPVVDEPLFEDAATTTGQ